MREMINYILEANVALVLFLVFYRIVLRNETNFQFLRAYLLAALFLSLSFPLMHFNRQPEPASFSIGRVIPEYWLPEISVGGENGTQAIQQIAPTPAHDLWRVAGWIYIIGIGMFATWLVMQVGYVVFLTLNSRAYRWNGFRIIETDEDKPTFSFFNLIYIGKANALTEPEKLQVIRHESIHAKQLHSMDMLFVTLVKTAFWFNPLIKHYKRLFIQLHEFEADARAVENSDVNNYCGLLARVALQSHFPIASHFNESLTVKRIEMIRTIKTKIRPWKMAMVAFSMIACFVVIACNDQIVDEFAKSTISQTSNIPEPVRMKMTEYKEKHPEAKLTYMEGAADDIVKFVQTPEVKGRVVYEFDLKGEKAEQKGVLLTDIVQYADHLQTNDKVFMIVEQQPEFIGGFDALKKFIGDNLKYPSDGSEGTVYVTFVIDKDGKVLEPTVLRGVSPAADAEAVRVTGLMPNWKPGTQNGMAVKVRFNIPYKFERGAGASDKKEKIGAVTGQKDGRGVTIENIGPVNDKFTVGYTVDKSPGQTKIRGKVRDAQGSALPGVNVIIAGTTTGIATDEEGAFIIETSQSRGDVVFSFVGFDSQVISF